VIANNCGTPTADVSNGPAGGGGNLGERLVKSARRVLGRKPPSTTSPCGVPPERTSQPPRWKLALSRVRPSRCHEAQMDVQGGRICHVTAVRPPPDGSPGTMRLEKAPLRGAFSMRPRGLEPPRTNRSTRPSTLRVYQFRHRRVGGQYSRGEGPENRPMSGRFCPRSR
jgi:hypothetical protein